MAWYFPSSSQQFIDLINQVLVALLEVRSLDQPKERLVNCLGRDTETVLLHRSGHQETGDKVLASRHSRGPEEVTIKKIQAAQEHPANQTYVTGRGEKSRRLQVIKLGRRACAHPDLDV